jgi:hypothetical protein
LAAFHADGAAARAESMLRIPVGRAVDPQPVKLGSFGNLAMRRADRSNGFVSMI